MGVLEQLKKDFPNSPDCVRLKAALLFYGVQFDRLLAEAGKWAFPNFMPYHLPPGEAPFEGQRRIAIPYLFRMEDDTQVRIRIKDESPFSLECSADERWFHILENGQRVARTTFEPRLGWVDKITSDGTPMRSTGLSQHGEMLVLNVAPGCEYFVAPGATEKRTENLSCSFCLYGLPDKRMEPLGQELYQISLPDETYLRVIEACQDPNTQAKQLYMVGGSMLNPADEGRRFVELAKALNDAGLCDRYYVACGSGAIPKDAMVELKALGVRGACFNLEVWDAKAFARICPGKSKFVGRDAWLRALEDAVDVFGPNQVMTAFVGGVELEGDEGMTPEEALKSAQEAGEYLIPRGIQPVYSLHWRTTGANRGQEPVYSLPLFLQINESLATLRRKHKMPMNKEFLSKRGAYMQLEPDYDEGQW